MLASFVYAPAPGTVAYADNGLNQYISVAGAAPAYDARGDLTGLAGAAYGYDALNRLISATPAGGSAASLAYDAVGRLREIVAGAVTTRFLYDGAAAIAEYNGSNVLQRRFVHGPGGDEPLVWYEGSGTGDRRWLVADERGSVIAVSNASGVATGINSYDEYGTPGGGNVGRFQYTGQMWLGEAGVYHFKARAYAPALGRFLQADPIGYAGGLNLYAYVGNDPINFTDPSGLQQCRTDGSLGGQCLPEADPPPPGGEDVWGPVWGHPTCRGICIGDSDAIRLFVEDLPRIERPAPSGELGQEEEDEIVVTARRQPAPPPPRPRSQSRLTLVQCINCSVPRHPVCIEAAHICLQNNDRPAGDARERRRLGCMNAEAVCNGIVGTFSREDPRAEFEVVFPDHTVVIIRNGQAGIWRRGD